MPLRKYMIAHKEKKYFHPQKHIAHSIKISRGFSFWCNASINCTCILLSRFMSVGLRVELCPLYNLSRIVCLKIIPTLKFWRHIRNGHFDLVSCICFGNVKIDYRSEFSLQRFHVLQQWNILLNFSIFCLLYFALEISYATTVSGITDTRPGINCRYIASETVSSLWCHTQCRIHRATTSCSLPISWCCPGMESFS